MNHRTANSLIAPPENRHGDTPDRTAFTEIDAVGTGFGLSHGRRLPKTIRSGPPSTSPVCGAPDHCDELLPRPSDIDDHGASTLFEW